MRVINVVLEDSDWQTLNSAKGELGWRDFLKKVANNELLTQVINSKQESDQ